ncbi:transmembrane channel-like protein 7, partial [Scyliorhinus torazame]|uniref:transmembrane channel-like protein 7 n=1 Tax=Scyliorhinus torazame TaxID=75743 RepID=UPI003B5A59C8
TDLQEEFLRQATARRTRWQRLRTVLTRVLVNALILLVIGAAFYCIYRATEFSQARSKVTGIAGLLVQYLPSIVITLANLVTPLIFNQLVRLERYPPAMEIKLSLFRLVFLKLASLGVLLYSLWAQVTCDGEMLSAAACRRCGYNQEQYQCWETKIGQEMYKLMIFDLLIVVSIMILIDFPRKILVQYSSWKAVQLWGEQEFLLPQNVLELVYGQTVCWVGCFYSPLLPLLNTVKYILVFYLKEVRETSSERVGQHGQAGGDCRRGRERVPRRSLPPYPCNLLQPLQFSSSCSNPSLPISVTSSSPDNSHPPVQIPPSLPISVTSSSPYNSHPPVQIPPSPPPSLSL